MINNHLVERNGTGSRIDLRLSRRIIGLSLSHKCYLYIDFFIISMVWSSLNWNCIKMGLHYYLKSLFALTAVVGLAILTWNKATEIVREVAVLPTVTVQPTRLHVKQNRIKADEIVTGSEMQDDKSNHYSEATEPTAETVNRNGHISTTKKVDLTASVSVSTYATPAYGSSQTTKIYSEQAVESSLVRTTLPLTTTKKQRQEARTEATLRTKPTDSTDINTLTKPVDQINEKNSSEKHHVAFLKIHKTGSSTVQNIFLRFGYSRNLTFILAHDDTDKAETNFPNVISYSNSLNENNIVPPPAGHHFEILCCHVIYNRMQFEKYLPSDTAYIGIVREPVSRLESSFRYFNLYPDVSLSDFAANPLRYDRGLHSMSNNRMSFEFGFPLELFPNSRERPEELQLEIDRYISKLMSEFDLILINEKMDESLVLMKRTLNWHIKDIIYMEQLVAKRETRRFTETDIENLKSYLYLDIALYEAAVTEINKKIKNLGQDFIEEVHHFQQEKAKIQDFCSKIRPGVGSLSFERSHWDSAYNVTLNDCSLYQKYEIRFIQDIRMKQYGKVRI